jgi:hypothetical protein
MPRVIVASLGLLLMALIGLVGCQGSSDQSAARANTSATEPPAVPFLLGASTPANDIPMNLEIGTRPPTGAELKRAVTDVLGEFHLDLPGSSEEIAKQLGLRLWAFDFNGGPFGCWTEMDDSGERSRDPSREGATVPCDSKTGTLLVWLQPRVTQQMPVDLRNKLLSNKPAVPNMVLVIEANDKSIDRYEDNRNSKTPIVPLWFGWKDVDLKELVERKTIKPGEAASLVRIFAKEKDAANPRSASFQLMIKKPK